MIIHDVQQGTDEWRALRAGIPTASQFHRIITPKTLKPSASQSGYMCELVAERLLGYPVDDVNSGFIVRGIDQEPQARTWYELVRQPVTPVGFITDDSGKVGCSPDALVGDDGGLEVKVPGAAKHVHFGFFGPDDYKCQVQGCLWVTGRKWWDVMSYNTELDPVVHRWERDEEFIGALADEVQAFCKLVDEHEAMWREKIADAA